MSPAVLLLGSFTVPETLAVSAAAESCGAKARTVSAEEEQLSVGELAARADLPGAAPGPASPGGGRRSGARALLLANVQSETLDALLAAFSARGVTGIPKAVVTKHNRAWTAKRLLAELEKEQLAFRNTR